MDQQDLNENETLMNQTGADIDHSRIESLSPGMTPKVEMRENQGVEEAEKMY